MNNPVLPGLLVCGLLLSALAVLEGRDAAAAPPNNGLDDITGTLAPLLPKNARLVKLVGDLRFTEGPVRDGASLLFSDIPADTIYRWTPGRGEAEGELDVFRRPSGETNGNTLDRQGRLISCEHKNRRVSRTEKDGTVVTLAERYEGKRLNSPNDVVVSSDGSIYFTDPPYGLPNGSEGKELDFNGVYRIAPDGTLSLLVRDFERPNGLCFSPDEKRLYVNDTQRGHIRVFDVAQDGTLGAGRVFAELRDPGKQGAPDGMKADVRGNIYCTGPGGVWIFAPDGTLRGKIIAPEVPANVGWGDRDNKTLYLTAQTGLYKIRCKIAGVRVGGGK